MTSVYLASRYTRFPEIESYANALEARGYKVTSRWHKGSHQITDEQLEDGLAIDLRRQFAEEDLSDLLAAEICISFTEVARAHTSRGGRHVEFGIALSDGQRMIVVGHRENIFHCLEKIEFYSTWAECLTVLEKENERSD